jgi:hypothetical protein
MDAHAHLLSLGWAGPGHSLDSQPYKQKGHRGLAYDPAKVGNTGLGLVKPLSISQRQGRFGIGKKVHEPQAGNEWWLKGFESALGNIGKSESERSSGTSTPVTLSNAKHGGLYSFFVKGRLMEGTITEEQGKRVKKRKSDVLDEDAKDFEQAGVFFALRDKDEKRNKREIKQDDVTQFEVVSEFLEARNESKEKKKRKSEALDVNEAVENEALQAHKTERTETKEERRERRRKRREEKELRRKRKSSGKPG